MTDLENGVHINKIMFTIVNYEENPGDICSKCNGKLV